MLRAFTTLSMLASLTAAALFLGSPHPVDAASFPRVTGEASPIAPFDAPQSDAEIAALAGGGFVVVFTEGYSSSGVILPLPPVDGRDGDVEGILAQRVDGDGRSIGGPIVVNATRDGSQNAPDVAADPLTGGFVVAWLDAGQPRLRRFDASGSPSIGELAVAEQQLFAPFEIFVAVDSDGHALVVWEPVDSGSAIQAVSVDRDGRIGPIYPITEEPSGRYRSPRLVASPSGGFFVTWYDERDLRGRHLESSGAPLSPVLDLGPIGPLSDLVPLDRRGGSHQLLATTQTINFPDPIQVFVIDPVSATTRPPIVLPHGAFGRTLALDPESFLQSVQDDTGSKLRGIDADGETTGQLLLENPVAGPIALAVDERDRVLAAWTGDHANVTVLPMAFDSPRLGLGVGQRFEARVTWRDFEGQSGDGIAVPLAEDTGAFWFFDPANIEVTVKVLDGRVINGHYWVFNGSLTNVEYTLTVTDTATGAVYTFTNPLGQFGSFGDTEALPGS